MTLNEIRNSYASDIMENQSLAHFNRPADSGDVNLGASSCYYNYCQPLLTISEKLAYLSRSIVINSHVNGSKSIKTLNNIPCLFS